MNILLTGSTGFLGKHIIEFYENNKEVNLILIGRNELKLKDISYKKENFVKLDLTNKEDLTKVFESKKIDMVIHSAAKSNDWGSYKDFYENNFIATKNIVDCAKEFNIKRMIHISTPSIYFNFKNRKNITEYYINSELVNNYAKTKKMAEELLLNEFNNNNFKFIGIRPRGIYGEYDETIFPKIIKLANKGSMPLIKNGQSIIDITYVKNVVHSIDLAIKAKKECEGNFYNITDGTPKKVIDILNYVFKSIDKKVVYKKINYNFIKYIAIILEKYSLLTNKEPLITKYSISLLAFDQTLNIDKAKKDLGYEPIYSFEEGIKNFVEWKK
jgi:nucleoside-diphosphate-sugar epimerase